MVRFMELVGILVLFLILAWKITTWMRYQLDGPSFLYALLMAAITGFSFTIVDGWWRRATRPNRPQIAGRHSTDEAPNEVIRSALLARLALFLTAVVTIILIVTILLARR